jgi:hypothetical protein
MAAQFRGARTGGPKADIARGYVRCNIPALGGLLKRGVLSGKDLLHNVSFRKSLDQFSRQKASILL